MLDATSHEEVGWISSTRLTTIISWGMTPGVSTLTVANHDDQQGSLAKAFTVIQDLGIWSTGGPYRGSVQELLMDPVAPTTLYAPIFSAGLLATYNGAAHWELIPLGGSIYPAIDTQNPDVIYAGGGCGQLRFKDGSTSWKSITILDPSVGCFIHDSVTHPASPGVVYVETRTAPPHPVTPGEDGFYRAQDYGESWLTMTIGFTDTHITAIAFHLQNHDFMAVSTDPDNLFVSNNRG